MEDTTRQEFGQNQNSNLAGAVDVDDDGCEGVKMREGGRWVFTILGFHILMVFLEFHG